MNESQPYNANFKQYGLVRSQVNCARIATIVADMGGVENFNWSKLTAKVLKV